MSYNSRKLLVTCLVSNDLVHDQRMQRVCDTLQQAGHFVTLIGRKKKSSSSLRVRSYKQMRLNIRFEKGFLFYAVLNIRLFLHLMANRSDLVYAVDMDTMPAAVLAAKLKGIKLAYDAHEYFSESPELVGAGGVKTFWQLLEKALIRFADSRITVSYSLAEQLEKTFGKTFVVVRNLPLLYPLPEPATEEKFILYQGALNTGRGLEVMIRAMHQLPLKLVIAGEGDLSGELRDLARLTGLTGKVSFLGWQSPESLRELAPKAWLGVNILEPVGMSYKLSLANKFFDYVMAGVPVLCTPFAEYKRADEEYHVSQWVSSVSIDRVVEAVRELLDKPELYNTLRHNCLQAREVWSWENEKRVLISQIDHLA